MNREEERIDLDDDGLGRGFDDEPRAAGFIDAQVTRAAMPAAEDDQAGAYGRIIDGTMDVSIHGDVRIAWDGRRVPVEHGDMAVFIGDARVGVGTIEQAVERHGEPVGKLLKHLQE